MNNNLNFQSDARPAIATRGILGLKWLFTIVFGLVVLVFILAIMIVIFRGQFLGITFWDAEISAVLVY